MALIKEIKKDTVKRQWRIISLVFAQLIIAVLVIVQLLDVVGFSFDLKQKAIAFVPNPGIEDILILAVGILLFGLLYFAIKKRHPELYLAQKRAPSIIKDLAKEKIMKIKTEPQAPALLFIEFLFGFYH